jgi:hypothetical protein
MDCSTISMLPGGVNTAFGWYHFNFLMLDGTTPSALQPNQLYSIHIVMALPISAVA